MIRFENVSYTYPFTDTPAVRGIDLHVRPGELVLVSGRSGCGKSTLMRLANGIWEALITTIMGLCVAIPTLMLYYFLMLRFKGFHIEVVEHSYRALDFCQRRKNRREQEDDDV